MVTMDYRASTQYRPGMGPGPTPSHARSTTRSKPPPEPEDLMLLPDSEIAGCVSDIGLPFTVQDLQKPQPQQIQKVFEWFAEILMNVTRETVDPAMRAAVEDICGDHADIVNVDTRSLLGFYASLRKLLGACGVDDLALSDLFRPTHARLVRILSYIINFVRFRESQTSVIDEYFNRVEGTKARIDSLYAENQDMEARMTEIQQTRKELESTARTREEKNARLKKELKALHDGQQTMGIEHDALKTKRETLKSSLEEKIERLKEVQQECEKLRPYASLSSSALQDQLAELSESLAKDKAHLNSLERRSRALQTSTDTFALAASDVNPCITLLKNVSDDLAAEEKEAVEAAKRRDALAERGNTVREVERTEKLLQSQLARWVERNENLRTQARERSDQASARMKELRQVHAGLVEERGDRGREVERRRVRIEQTEKKMADLKENIESEVHAAHEEYLKMDAHINLYMKEMEQVI